MSAARFTRSGLPAAPVLLCQERCELSRLRVIVANSGCANAATGPRGLDAAAQVQAAAATATGVPAAAVAPASTGAISHQLPVERVLGGVAAAGAELGHRRRRRAGRGDPHHGRVLQARLRSPSSFPPAACA